MKYIWKAVPGYEGIYEVSNIGDVKHLGHVKWRFTNIRGVDIPPRIGDVINLYDSRGYMQVTLVKNNIRKIARVHRLVAMAFIPNPNNKPEVNHKNGIRYDNRVENLEWVTKSENERHKYKTGYKTPQHVREAISRANKGSNHAKARKVKCLETGQVFGSTIEASKTIGLSRNAVFNCCKGFCKTAGGFHWEYTN